MLKKFHSSHMIEKSPWPLMASIAALLMMMNLVWWFNSMEMKFILSISMITVFTAIFWWTDISKETNNSGNHTPMVNKGLQLGMLLFITSEVLFFTAFFWAFFHSSISPTIELGQDWPPKTITPFNPLNVPLLNTLILLSSGISITWSHHSIMMMEKNNSNISLILTVTLGMVFTALQAMEYNEAPYSIHDSCFGSTFFMATGFHGLHVIIGSSFLLTTLKRMNNNSMSPIHVTGFECSAWYWHFVDVVWLFLYTSLYWWGC